MAGSRPAQKTSLLAFEAWMLSAASTAALKGMTAREGPADGDENDFWKGGDFFPSGHTSRTFAVAAAVAERHGRRAAWIAYPLAALVGLARIETGAHWASDVAAGAALGIAVGRAVARRHPTDPVAPAGGEPARLRWGAIPVRGGIWLELRLRID
jgi:membrane-associated phospholipid phosphatase